MVPVKRRRLAATLLAGPWCSGWVQPPSLPTGRAQAWRFSRWRLMGAHGLSAAFTVDAGYKAFVPCFHAF